MHRSICGIVFLLLSFNLWGQKIKFSHINKTQGLSQSSVNAIVQDDEGFMWFATDDGLNKYDGITMTVYKDDPKGKSKSALSDREIKALFVDKSGLLWIGTGDGGINRYHKYTNTFKVYAHDSADVQSLSDNSVHCFAQNDKNYLWIGTDAGLNRLNIQSGKVTRFLATDATGAGEKILPGDKIRSIFVDKDGSLWLGTHGDGLLHFFPDDQKVQQYIPRDSEGNQVSKFADRVKSIYRDSKGRLWVGFDGAYLAQFDEEQESFSFYRYDSEDPNSISSRRVNAIFEDHNGQLWIGTAEGINLYIEKENHFRIYEKDENNPFALNNDFIQCFFEDEAHSLWVGTSAGGASVYHRTLGKFNHFKKEKTSRFSLQENKVFAFEEDNEGNIWIGTIGAGLTAVNFDKTWVRHYDYDKNKTHSDILCVHQSVDNFIWFGSWGGGFNYYNPFSRSFGEPIKKKDKGLSSSTILNITDDEKGNLWIATFKGLNYYDRQEDTIYAYTTKYDFRDPKGNPIKLPSNQIYNVQIIGDHLWFGTNGNGLGKLNLKTKSLEVFQEEDGSISNNTILCIQYAGGYLWAGTKTGLNRIDPETNEVENFFETDGLESDYINAVEMDDKGFLWISTNSGLSKFKPKEEDGEYLVRNYHDKDGLQGNEFNQGASLKSKEGELFFGGINGLNHFYAENIVDNPHKPPIAITSFKIFGKEYKLDSSVTHKEYIELSYKQNFFSFEFAALDYVLPEKNLYQYKMKGLDEDWSVPTHRPFASYTGLEGGDYVFMVRAANNDGVWNKDPIEIHITIVPPFWKTDAFYIGVSLFLIISVVLGVRYRLRKIKKEKRVLEEKVAERTFELKERTDELAEKNKDIMDSINYAQKIQTAILPPDNLVKEYLNNSFILYKPKDIVAGDFYWMEQKGDKVMFAAADCTGHGVPGAMVSVVCNNGLNRSVREYGLTDPGEILDKTREIVIEEFDAYSRSDQAKGSGDLEIDTTEGIKDGMDIALCIREGNKIHFAGAHNPLWVVRGDMLKAKPVGNKTIEEIIQEKPDLEPLEEIKADKQPIGKFAHATPFQSHTVELNPGDTIYVFSDGYADQFGGKRGKKFKAKNFKRLVLAIQSEPMERQLELIDQAFEYWKGDIEQLDDVCVIGVRV